MNADDIILVATVTWEGAALCDLVVRHPTDVKVIDLKQL